MNCSDWINNLSTREAAIMPDRLCYIMFWMLAGCAAMDARMGAWMGATVGAWMDARVGAKMGADLLMTTSKPNLKENQTINGLTFLKF